MFVPPDCFSSLLLETWIYTEYELENAKNTLHQIVTDLSRYEEYFTCDKEIIFRFNRVLLDNWGVSVIQRATGHDFTLCNVLLKRNGNCLGIVTLYVAIGELLGLPFHVVLYEGHVAIVIVRQESTFYFDVTKLNSPVCEKLMEKINKNNHRILTRDEFSALHLSNQSVFFYVKHGLMDDAVFLIDSALEIFPDYTAGWINRAVIMKKLDNVVEMKRSLDTAKSLNPGVRYARAIEQIEKINF